MFDNLSPSNEYPRPNLKSILCKLNIKDKERLSFETIGNNLPAYTTQEIDSIDNFK